MLAMICMGFGLNAGNAMNPARDFGPRLFSAFAGYGQGVFT
jgi:glycerol uptake facilitator-like aquaporin